MGKKISEIYTEYKIIQILQEHMLRTAAVASIICDNFDEPLPKEDIITACLLHDMGNILKFKWDSPLSKFLEPEGLEYWNNIQNEYRKKYGSDEHKATIKIAQELQVSDKILELINSISFLGSPQVALSNNYNKKIVEYCDDRVGPFGVISLEKRFMDLRERYAHHGEDTPERSAFENAVRQMEKQIFAKCIIKPEDINDETVASVISELRSFMLK